MASLSLSLVSQHCCQSIVNNTRLAKPSFRFSPTVSTPLISRFPGRIKSFETLRTAAAVEVTAELAPEKKNKGFVEEMKAVARRMHSKEHLQEGQKEAETPEQRPVGLWEPNLDGYLNYLVANKLVHYALEHIIDTAAFPCYAELKSTGLERSEKLAADLKWLEEQGYELPETSSPGENYAQYLKNLSHKDPQAFLCHYYNIHFGFVAGGKLIGKMVKKKIFPDKEFEFYKWDCDVSQLMHNVRVKLNDITQEWTKEEKKRCLDETETAFVYMQGIIRLMLS